MFKGTYTALVTPFRDGAFDSAAFAELIEAQIAGGVDGIIPVGTTGESPTLSHAEHLEVVESAVRYAKGRCKVIAGTGSNATSEAIDYTLEAEKCGADAALLVAPYYNKPSQEGVYRHYKAIATATRIPLVLYSIPGRCGIEIGVETVARLAADCPNIVAIKEAGGAVERVSQLRTALPPAFTILSGDDSLTLPFMAAGAVGVISVASNLVPEIVVDLVRKALNNDYAAAREVHLQYYPLFKDLFIEPNPVPVKVALNLKTGMSAEVRPPLCEMADATLNRLTSTLRNLGIIS